MFSIGQCVSNHAVADIVKQVKQYIIRYYRLKSLTCQTLIKFKSPDVEHYRVDLDECLIDIDDITDIDVNSAHFIVDTMLKLKTTNTDKVAKNIFNYMMNNCYQVKVAEYQKIPKKFTNYNLKIIKNNQYYNLILLYKKQEVLLCNSQTLKDMQRLFNLAGMNNSEYLDELAEAGTKYINDNKTYSVGNYLSIIEYGDGSGYFDLVKEYQQLGLIIK